MCLFIFYLFKTKNALCNWSYDVTLRVTAVNLGKIFPDFQGISRQFFLFTEENVQLCKKSTQKKTRLKETFQNFNGKQVLVQGNR